MSTAPAKSFIPKGGIRDGDELIFHETNGVYFHKKGVTNKDPASPLKEESPILVSWFGLKDRELVILCHEIARVIGQLYGLSVVCVGRIPDNGTDFLYLEGGLAFRFIKGVRPNVQVD